jgi:ferredoxin
VCIQYSSYPTPVFAVREVVNMSTFRITIDLAACDAYGYCVELLPEAITLDEWGYPIVENQPILAESVASAKRAVRDCPRRAITLSQLKE